MPDLVGKTLGGYRIIEQIGLGGMATVFKAYQASMDRYVAFKVMSTHFAQDPTFVKRFQQEAKVIARLGHPYILPVHDYGEQDGYLYLVMRFIEGGTLKDRLERGPLALGEARRVVSQVGSALAYAHQAGVVHRDLKPSNVLIDAQGDCYLSDFGIAKMLEGTLKLTGSAVLGTPHYMAPEQGQSLQVDHRTDIYAMGVVIYEMVTGQVPFDAETPFAVVLKHLTEPLPLPRRIKPDLPEGVERVILKALAKEPADRYPSMRDLVDAFDQAVQAASSELAGRIPADEPGGGAALSPASGQDRGQPAPARPRRWLLAAVGAAVLLPIIAVLVLAGVLLGRPKADGGEVRVKLGGATMPTLLAMSTQPAGQLVTETATPAPAQSPSPAATATPEPTPPATLPQPTQAPTPTLPAPTLAPTLAAPTATPAPGAATLSPLPAGSWQPLADLPRQVNALAVDPANPQVLYAGTGQSGAGSGVYKSEDGGLTWRSVSAGLPSEEAVALAFSTTTPPVLYAAVGNSIFASADSGASWSQLAQGVGNYRGFERLYVAPHSDQVLYGVAVVEGVFRSDDGGRNWMALSQGLPKNNDSLNVQSLAINPADANVVYLGTGSGPFGGNGVYKSTDAGQNWSPANRGMLDYSIMALAVDPLHAQTVYAGSYDGELFKSSDGGATWNDLTANIPDETRAIVAISVDPAASETIYMLGGQGVLVSYDGGARWRLLGRPGQVQHPTFTAMAVMFGPQPALVAGISGEGGWRYAPGQ